MFSGVCVFCNTGSSAFQLLRNVTSGSFLEADQLREINVPLQPHACNAVLRRIIDEECDIMQKCFRFHRSNCPQLNEGTFGGIWARRWNAESEVLTFEHQWRIIGLLICNLGAQKGSISGWFWFAFPFYFDIQAKLHRRIMASFFFTHFLVSQWWRLIKSIIAWSFKSLIYSLIYPRYTVNYGNSNQYYIF